MAALEKSNANLANASILGIYLFMVHKTLNAPVSTHTNFMNRTKRLVLNARAKDLQSVGLALVDLNMESTRRSMRNRKLRKRKARL